MDIESESSTNCNEIEAQRSSQVHLIEDDVVDWRGRSHNPTKHGGMRAAVFVLGLQSFEIMAIAAVGNNLITYLMKDMNFPLSKSANIVTNFVGTIFIMALLGGFLSDSYLGCFTSIVVFGFLELSGFAILSLQAHLPQLKPRGNEEAKGVKSLILYVGLYMVAVGSGCVKPNMVAYGANQFHESKGRKLRTYFNAAYFAFCFGELVALTILVWVQTSSGMDVGFGLSAAVMAIGLLCLVSGIGFFRNKVPKGNIFSPIFQTLLTAISGGKENVPYRWSSNLENQQVNQLKTLKSVIPIFACTIIFNTILAQLQTFSVQQGASMNTNLVKSFHIPPASLQSIPYFILLIMVPLYDVVLVPFARRLTGNELGISSLQRIGGGLLTATFSMVAAAMMERRRQSEAIKGKLVSIFWITPQFLIFGVAEMLTAVGLVEFFYMQTFKGMEAFLVAMTYCSYSFGFFFSSILVELVNKITTSSRFGKGWLGDNDLNNDRLDLFYWLLGALSFVNFFHFLFWARWHHSYMAQIV